MRVGICYDSHRFVEGRALILGGQHIPHPVEVGEKHLASHGWSAGKHKG